LISAVVIVILHLAIPGEPLGSDECQSRCAPRKRPETGVKHGFQQDERNMKRRNALLRTLQQTIEIGYSTTTGTDRMLAFLRPRPKVIAMHGADRQEMHFRRTP
jgi:hypothetical protein